MSSPGGPCGRCPACGRPAGAHKSVGSRAARGLHNRPQGTTCSCADHDRNPKALTCPRDRGNLRDVTSCEPLRGRYTRAAGQRGSDLAADRRRVGKRDTGRFHVEPIALPGGVRVDRMAAELLNCAKKGGHPDFFRCGSIFFATCGDSQGSHEVPGEFKGAQEVNYLYAIAYRVLWYAFLRTVGRRIAAILPSQGGQQPCRLTTAPPIAVRSPQARCPRLLTLRDVTQATALSRSAVYALMAASRFPKPIRIGSRAVRWVEQEVLDFIASRPRGGTERPAA